MEITTEQTCQDLFQLMHYAKVRALQLAEEQGLTRVQLFTLYSIDQYGDLAMGQVAHMLHCDASNVTGIVDRMVGQGLVKREENPKDRRAKRLVLTPKGKEAVQCLRAALPAKIGCEKLTNAERATLHTIIGKLSA